MILKILLITLLLIFGIIILSLISVKKYRSSINKAIKKIKEIDIEQISDWAEEFRIGIKSKANIDLNYADIGKTAEFIDKNIKKVSFEIWFKKKEMPFYHAYLISSFLGQSIIKSIPAAMWVKEDDGPAIEIPIKGESVKLFPFEKILKQLSIGSKGDIIAYFKVLKQMGNYEFEINDYLQMRMRAEYK